MSYINFEGSSLTFYDASNKAQKLIDLNNLLSNQSDLLQILLHQELQSALPKLFNRTPESLLNALIYLVIVARLLNKPQVHNVLKIGAASSLDEVLADTLPKFNPESKFYCYATKLPERKFQNVNLILAQTSGGGLFIPENKFASVIFLEQRMPSFEVLLAAEDWGKIYFVSQRETFQDFLAPHVKYFELAENSLLYELELTPEVKQEIRRRSPQGQIEEKKSRIKATVLKALQLPERIKNMTPAEINSCLDEYIAEISSAERILNEIFPALHSTTIKMNLNMFKEFLIDFRLYNNYLDFQLYKDCNLKKMALEDLERQYKILAQDLNNV